MIGFYTDLSNDLSPRLLTTGCPKNILKTDLKRGQIRFQYQSSNVPFGLKVKSQITLVRIVLVFLLCINLQIYLFESCRDLNQTASKKRLLLASFLCPY